MNVDVNELKSWIGNEDTTFDEVTKSLESRFRRRLILIQITLKMVR